MAAPTIEVSADIRALMRVAAEGVIDSATRAIAARDRFVWCLSGGSTPRALYELLASSEYARRLDWSRTQLCFGDERCVAPDDAASNYRMVAEAMLRHVPLPAANLHRIPTELEPAAAASAYEATLQRLLGVGSGGAPEQRFDLVLLGLGPDGHTASLFPNSQDAPGAWVSAREAKPIWRITLTPLALNAADTVRFLVAGPDKAERLAQIIEGPRDPVTLPAQRIAPQGSLGFWLDKPAAAKLRAV
jgi:6-phosphogluconolactonase